MGGFSRRSFLIAAAGTPFLISTGGPASAFEPITTAIFIGTALLQGALSAFGGEMFDQAMGNAQIIDVKTWIRNAVVELESYVESTVRKELLQVEIDMMSANLDSVLTNLNHYKLLKTESRKNNRDLLDATDQSTAVLVPLSLQHPQALAISILSFGYRLITMTELARIDNDQGHIRSLSRMATGFVDKVGNTSKDIADAMRPERRVENGCWREPDGSTTDRWICFVSIDGKTAETSTGYYEMNRSNFTLARAKTYYPAMQKQQDDFIALTQAALYNASSLYDEMSKLAGESFPVTGSPLPPGFVGVNLKSDGAEAHVK